MTNEQNLQENRWHNLGTSLITISTVLFSAILWIQLLFIVGCGGPLGDDNSTTADSNNITCIATIVDERELGRLIDEADNGEGGVTSVDVYATDEHGDITINLCTETTSDDDNVLVSPNVTVQAANANAE